MGKILQFKSCAVGGEYSALGAVTPTGYGFVFVQTPANLQAQLDAYYNSDPNLAGKVIGIGYGWQQYTLEQSGIVKFTVRGGAGGSTGRAGYAINPSTGAVTGTGNRPGRGAKIVGTCKLKKGDVLYMLVGMRGWSNNGNDWGGSGGGASVVLRANPSGAFTFGPLNCQVDVLFVAGGGGGCFDQSFGTNYYGRDASYDDGVNTNAGSAATTGAGAGLTGNGNTTKHYTGVKSILSGALNYPSAVHNAHIGAWGGGAPSCNGGGGGGGYSGGSAADSRGADGGTSFINPNLCTEVFRGYATVEDDGDRNLINPWTAYGFIELELGRDEDKYIVAKDSEGYKWFDGVDLLNGTINPSASDEWKLIPNQNQLSEPLSDDIYENYGNTIITNTVGLDSGKVRFLIKSENPSENISISGNANGTIVEMVKDCSLADISVMKSMTALTNLSNVSVKFAVSKNYGKTWQTYNGGNWVDINVKNKNQFQTIAYDMSLFAAIPLQSWMDYNAKTIRFMFCITQNGVVGSNSILQSISCLSDLVGSWRRFSEEEAYYEYVADDQLKVTFKQAGNYKVNYLDRLVSGS